MTDPVERDFTASRPNALWVAAATYIPTWEGFPVLGGGGGRLIPARGALVDGRPAVTALMLDALDMAFGQTCGRHFTTAITVPSTR